MAVKSISTPLNFSLSHPYVPDKIIFFLGHPGNLTTKVTLIFVLFCFDPLTLEQLRDTRRQEKPRHQKLDCLKAVDCVLTTARLGVMKE